MKKLDKLRMKWEGLANTVQRFLFAFILFAAAAISNAIAIYTEEDERYIKLMVSFFLGACLFIVFQFLYERFFEKKSVRNLFAVISAASALLYGSLIWNTKWEEKVTIRTAVIFFILLIAFLMVPVIKSRNNFNESFMAAFKSFFVTLLFFGVLFLGVSLIITATDMLIINVNEDAYLYAANLIFVLLAPIYFLSSIPYYPGKKELERLSTDVQTEKKDQQEYEKKQQANEKEQLANEKEQRENEKEQQENVIRKMTETKPWVDMDYEEKQARRREALEKLTAPAKFLETLISYVIIPITAVFTIILLLYIIMNITGDFWTDNLLEPLLVTYSITVIIVYLLASTLQNAFAVYFRKIFPKVLVPVVLFQTIAFVLRIGELGVTYGRYYVILFGVFATVAGILFCILPVRRNGMIAPILICLSIISIVPPVDAFTLSKTNQIVRLKKVLNNNDMLIGDTIVPNADISEEDKQAIITALNYLDRMNDTEDITWLASYGKSSNFEETFGFAQYGEKDANYESYYIMRDMKDPVSIEGYDFMARMNIYSEVGDVVINSFEKEGKTYSLHLDSSTKDNQEIILEEQDGQELLRFDYNTIFSKFSGTGSEKEALPTEEMTFMEENNAAVMTIVAESISFSEWAEGQDRTIDAYILIKIK